jgi:hypothetical protein
LERRNLLSAPAATWFGQDGEDLASATRPISDGILDIHLRLTGLPADRSLDLVDIRPLGGGRWRSDGQGGDWIVVHRESASSSADLYLNPYQTDAGRAYQIDLIVGGAPPSTLWVQGGPVDANLRPIGAAFQAEWIGQGGEDRTAPTSAVGPDGVVDVHLALSRMTTTAPLRYVRIQSPTGETWESGANPHAAWNLEVVSRTGDPASADVYFSAAGNLDGQALTVTAVYADGRSESTVVVAASTDPSLLVRFPRELPTIRWESVTATWLGQDGRGSALGDAHLRLDGLPDGRRIVAATLSDPAGLTWAHRDPDQWAYYVEPYARPLEIRQTPGSTVADLFFPPMRNEWGERLTARLKLDDGSVLITTLVGGFTDPMRRQAEPASSTIVVQPGDNLQDLVQRFDTVRLTAGVYRLDRPLVLSRSVSITADPGASLRFQQPADSAPWTAAIKIHAGRTTLDGFAVRFDGPVRWDWDVNFGPAVIGTTDNRDVGQFPPKVGLTFTRLDLEGPPAGSAAWEQTPDLIRLVGAEGGRIEGNRLRGGSIEFLHGPWRIVGNHHTGTPVGTYSFGVFIGHDTFDLVVEANRVEPLGPSGKTWRFLVLTVAGHSSAIRDNIVLGIGPRDNDTIPAMNAAEIVLTEAYRLHYEGAVAAVSADGRLLRIFAPQGDPPQAGAAVAVLDGPAAGQFLRVVQAIDPITLLLDAPLPSGTTSISLATGFVGTTFERNRIDSRGGSAAGNLVLVGSHFATTVRDNTFRGGNQAFKIAAAPTERPGPWGWSHTPFLDLSFVGNVCEDSAGTSFLGVEYAAATRASAGRVYLSGSFRDNMLGWSESGLRTTSLASSRLITIGDSRSVDPGEVRVSWENNQLRVPEGVSPWPVGWIAAARINGQDLRDQPWTLLPNNPEPALPPVVNPLPAPIPVPLPVPVPSAPSVADVGPVIDLIVTESVVSFGAVAHAAGYQFRVVNQTDYVALGGARRFDVPALPPGTYEIGVRAVASTGQAGPERRVSVTVANQPVAIWRGHDGSDRVGLGSGAGPDGFLDVHLSLTSLPGALVSVQIRAIGLPGGVWHSDPAPGARPALLTQSPGSSRADLWFPPWRRDSARRYKLTLRFADGSVSTLRLQGGPVVPRLRTLQAARRLIRSLRAAPR